MSFILSTWYPSTWKFITAVHKLYKYGKNNKMWQINIICLLSGYLSIFFYNSIFYLYPHVFRNLCSIFLSRASREQKSFSTYIKLKKFSPTESYAIRSLFKENVIYTCSSFVIRYFDPWWKFEHKLVLKAFCSVFYMIIHFSVFKI